MIWQPKPGQCVRVHYRPGFARIMPFQGLTGRVLVASRGPGPRNVLVEIDLPTGKTLRVGIPRGNLVAIPNEKEIAP